MNLNKTQYLVIGNNGGDLNKNGNIKKNVEQAISTVVKLRAKNINLNYITYKHLNYKFKLH